MILKVTSKANSTLGFLKRNTWNCPTEVKAKCYQTFVRTTLEYASTIYDPHTQANINKLEMTQRRAARYVTGITDRYSSVTAMLEQFKWKSLEQRRSQAKVVMMYRIVNGLIAIPLHNYLSYSTSTTRGHSLKLMVPYARLDVYKYSFFPSTVRLWNNQLSDNVVTAPTLDAFKAGVGNINIQKINY